MKGVGTKSFDNEAPTTEEKKDDKANEIEVKDDDTKSKRSRSLSRSGKRSRSLSRSGKRPASLESLFPPVVPTRAPEKRASLPTTVGKEWHTDLTKSMSDEHSTNSFDQLWGRDSTRRSRDDESAKPEDGKNNSPSPANAEKPSSSELFKGIENTAPKKFSSYDEQVYESDLQIKAFSSQVASLESQLDCKDADLQVVEKQLRASLIDSNRVEKQTSEELKALQNQISDLQEALDTRGEQVETLQRQLDVAYSENNQEMYNAELKIKGFREQIASMQESLDKKEAEIEELRQKLENVDREHENRLCEERDESNMHLKDFREQVTALQDALDEKDTQAFKLQSRVDEAECENKILLEELEQLMKEKNEIESMAMAGGDSTAATRKRIEDLEEELEHASKVANLQLEELDEQVDELREKLKAERLDASTNIKTRDATIEDLTLKLRRYEAVPNTTAHSYSFQPSMQKSKHSMASEDGSVMTEKSGHSFAVASGAASFAPSYGLTEATAETPAINTDDVTDVESAKQKVYEARADATSVRESLEISTKRCAELTLANEALVKKNSRLVDTTRERDELKDSVRDWTAQTYQWKRRAEDAEAKLAELQDGTDSKHNNDSDHQGMMIKAAMENRSGRGMGPEATEKKSGWSLFGRTTTANTNSTHNSNQMDHNGSDGDPSSEDKDARIDSLNETIAKLRSEVFCLNTAHKEEMYLTKKRIAQLEGENEALTLQNGTLEQLSRFHAEP